MKAINRMNRMGQQYYITQIPSDVEITKIRTGDKRILVRYGIDQIDQSWFNWTVKGMMAQDAFPYLTADEREFLISGLTDEDWDLMFPTGEETDNGK